MIKALISICRDRTRAALAKELGRQGRPVYEQELRWEKRKWCMFNWNKESEVAQSCLTLCDPMDCSLPSSSVHGIVQARILEWVAISFSRGSSWPTDGTCISCIDGWILYHWATREAPTYIKAPLNIVVCVHLLLNFITPHSLVVWFGWDYPLQVCLPP